MTSELIVLLTAMTPFAEMKLAIPLGLNMGLSTTTTMLFAVTGSIIPAAILLALIDPASKILRKKSKIMDRFFEKLFHKTRNTHSKRFQSYGALIIIMFIAIPLPGSGSGAGALIAFVFGVDYWKAFSLIVLGTAIGGFLLTAGIGSALKLMSLLN